MSVLLSYSQSLAFNAYLFKQGSDPRFFPKYYIKHVYGLLYCCLQGLPLTFLDSPQILDQDGNTSTHTLKIFFLKNLYSLIYINLEYITVLLNFY